MTATTDRTGRSDRSQDNFPLVGLQFLALSWVVLNQFRFHLNLHAGDHSGLVFKGYLGAELFFVTTGFLVADLYLRESAAGGFRYGAFLWRKLSWVYPLHVVALAAMAGLVAAADVTRVHFPAGVASLHGLISNLLLVQAWGAEPTVSWNFPSWLISAEWFACLAFPATAWITFKGLRPAALAVIAPLILFAILFQAAAMRGVLFSDMTAQIGALQTVPAFLLGAGLCRLSRERSLPAGWGAILAAVAGIGIVGASLLRLSDLVLFPAFGVLVYGLAEAAKARGRGPSDAVLAYLGRIAHAIYLVYLPVDIVYFHGVERLVGQPTGAEAWAIWTGVFPVILLVGIAAHHLIQAPVAAFLDRHRPFGGHRPAKPAAA